MDEMKSLLGIVSSLGWLTSIRNFAVAAQKEPIEKNCKGHLSQNKSNVLTILATIT